MFTPKTKRIAELATLFPDAVRELEVIFADSTNVYIDWANVIHWQERLGFHIHLGRLKQLLDSFSHVKIIRFYTGTLLGNEKSEQAIMDAENLGYQVKTKPVKVMKMSINTSSIAPNSPALLENFIKKCLLSKLSLETIELLNEKLTEFNKQGVTFIEDMKCNFDVEIGRDMLQDFDMADVDTFILWSGDSDFVDPINQLVKDEKKVFLFATARAVSYELNEIKVPIFDIKKIKEFICWPKEIPQNIKDKIDR